MRTVNLVITHVVSSLDKGVILHALHLDVNVDSEAFHPLWRAEVHKSVDLRVLRELLLACLGCDELEGAEEACCTRFKGNRQIEAFILYACMQRQADDECI